MGVLHNQVRVIIMAVFIFKTIHHDPARLAADLIKRGVTPKVNEPGEAAEPKWRETTNFVHIATYGHMQVFSRPEFIGRPVRVVKEPDIEPGKKEHHVHKYYIDGHLVAIEETKYDSIIVNLAEDVLPKVPHMSFGNGVTIIDYGMCKIAFVVVDHKLADRALEVIEEVRL